MTMNNNNGVEKEHDFFSFQAIGGHQDVEV